MPRHPSVPNFICVTVPPRTIFPLIIFSDNRHQLIIFYRLCTYLRNPSLRGRETTEAIFDPCKLRGHSGENEESQRLPRPDTPGLATTFQVGLPRPDGPGLAMTLLQLFFGARCIIGYLFSC